MIRLARDVRLIPIVLFATISLLALKVSGLVFDGGYTFAERMQARYNTELQITSPESVHGISADHCSRASRAIPDAPRPQTVLGEGNVQFNLGTKNDITGSGRTQMTNRVSPHSK